jgi:hypothetical protein
MKNGKSLLHPLTMGVDYFTPPTIKPFILPSELFKTGQIIFQAVLDGGFATITMVLSFSFLFISVEFLKNHSKS